MKNHFYTRGASPLGLATGVTGFVGGFLLAFHAFWTPLAVAAFVVMFISAWLFFGALDLD